MKEEELGGDPSLYHYTAVAAFNSGRYREARQYWLKAQKLDPLSDIPRFYLDQLEKLDLNGGQRFELSYHYHLPFEEQLKRWEQNESELCEEVKSNPLIRSSFFWALRYGDKGTKLQVIRALGWIADDEVRETLKAFLNDPEETSELKKEALRVLNGMGLEGSVQAVLEAGAASEMHVAETEASYEYDPAGDTLQAVVDQAWLRMDEGADREKRRHLQNLWFQFLGKLYPEKPLIRHTEGWSAALEYLTAKQRGSSLTYQEVAQRYGVSVSTVSRYAKRIDSVCSPKDEKDDIFRPFTENI